MAKAVRDRSNYEKNKVQYSSWQWAPLVEMQRQVPQNRAAKQRRTTQSPYDVSAEHVIKFTPYSASYAARSTLHNEAAGTHLFHTAFTFDELCIS